MPDMTSTSFAAPVAPRTGKIFKNGLRVFEIRENLLQNGILTTLQVKPIVRTKLEFTQTKNGLF